MENSSFIEIKRSQIKLVFVLALGGTISSVARHPAEEFYCHSSTEISELLSSLPIDHEKTDVVCEQFLQQISHEMTFDELVSVAKKIQELVNDELVDGVVVTQGTNSIEETAYFINLVIKTKKNIVFTGSHRPINSLGYDGSRNLYNAILLASSKPHNLGVLLTFNDYIVNAREASKFNPSILDDFSASGIGVVGFIRGNEVLIQKVPQYKHTLFSEFSIYELKEEPKIYVIYGHICADNTFVEAAIRNNARGIISAGMGKGYQPKKVTEALVKASEKDIFIVRCSRTGQGFVNKEPGFDDNYGFIVAGSLTPQKARILLTVAISKTQNRTEIQRIFDEY